MFPRFAAATAVASAMLAVAATFVLSLPVPVQRFAPVMALWCILPAVWGLWALLAPRAWVPARLPVWGAILGALAGTLVMFVLNLPQRIALFEVSPAARALAVVLLTGFYYLLWMLVRAAYQHLAPTGSTARAGLAAD